MLIWRFVDWFSSGFSDPYLRVERGSSSLESFQPLGKSPKNPNDAEIGDQYHVPSGLGGVFTVKLQEVQHASHDK
jgi:hypothetical protein